MAFEQILNRVGGGQPAASPGGAPVMLTLGSFSFSVTQAAYQTLSRQSRYRWPVHERIGVRPWYQSTGPGEDSIALSGAIMPTYRGRPGSVEDLRTLAAVGTPYLLTSGQGEVLGRWFISDVDEERSGLFSRGEARRIAFTVRLTRSDDAPSGRLSGVEEAAAAAGNVRGALDAAATATAAGASTPEVIAAARAAG